MVQGPPCVWSEGKRVCLTTKKTGGKEKEDTTKHSPPGLKRQQEGKKNKNDWTSQPLLSFPYVGRRLVDLRHALRRREFKQERFCKKVRPKSIRFSNFRTHAVGKSVTVTNPRGGQRKRRGPEATTGSTEDCRREGPGHSASIHGKQLEKWPLKTWGQRQHKGGMNGIKSIGGSSEGKRDRGVAGEANTSTHTSCETSGLRQCMAIPLWWVGIHLLW